MTELIAVTELNRLRHASAWSPVHSYAKHRNQHCAQYYFKDRSRLTVYFNGDVSWFHKGDDGQTSGEQRWRNWHRCNR